MGLRLLAPITKVGLAENLKGFKNFVVNVKTLEKAPLKVADGHKLTDWSKDGKRFLATQFYKDGSETRARQCLLNKDDGLNRVLTDEKQYCSDGRLSPDGRWVLFLLHPRSRGGRGEWSGSLRPHDPKVRSGRNPGKGVPSSVSVGLQTVNSYLPSVRREVHMGNTERTEVKEDNVVFW